MANLREISRRMNSIRSTMQITRTMEMISTARIRRALELAEDASPYKEAITRMLSNVAGAAVDVNEPLLQSHAVERCVLFIVIASDRGMAGGFNIYQERLVERSMHHLHAQGIETKLITCGRKPTEYFTHRGPTPDMSFVGISSEPNQDQADRIASFAMDGFTEGSIDRVMLYYWHARNRVDQDPVVERLLPVTREELFMPAKPRTHEAMTAVEALHHSEFSFDPSASEVLGFLMPAYVRTVILHALLDSAAAEHGARRRAMQSATDSAREVLANLSHTYNRVRQGSITTELTEIIGGAAALEESE